MLYLILADLLVVLHAAFIAFVVLGALLTLRWPRTPLVHLPCAAWGAFVEVAGWVCPLTPLEWRLRRLGGAAGYSDGFIEHYLIPLIYPPGLTPSIQLGLGVSVIALNVTAYAFVWRRYRRRAVL